VVVALLYVAGGAALAARTPAFDRWLGPDRRPSWLHVDPSVAQAQSTGFATNRLVAISVAFRVWIWRADERGTVVHPQAAGWPKSLFGQPSREPPELVKPTA
jgi:hypothetical protein